jgi:hypothetical protein
VRRHLALAGSQLHRHYIAIGNAQPFGIGAGKLDVS